MKPFDDKDVRWAISHYIDRQQLIEVGYLGASTGVVAADAALQAAAAVFRCGEGPAGEIQHAGIRSEEGRRAAAGKGFKKDGGIWDDPDGKPLTLDIIGFGAAGPAMGPVLSEMLKRHGVEASLSLPPDFDRPVPEGPVRRLDLRPWRQSLREPYDTLRLYQGQSIAVPGAHLVNFSRWKNAEFDKIVDEVYVTDPNNMPKMKDLFRARDGDLAAGTAGHPTGAELPPHPDEHHYWKNWPTADNAYINGASWHLTYPIVLWNLKPA